MSNNMRPIHPGEILREELETLGINASFLAKELVVPVNRVTSIINEKRTVTADTALRLACFFNTTPEFWLNLQAAYDLKLAKKQWGKKIRAQVHRYKMAA